MEEQREPLIPMLTTVPLACTGSMEPLITCLDTVTLLTNFHPEDIPVGAVISYQHNGWHILHRVTRIEVEWKGRRVFSAQGDNNPLRDEAFIFEDEIVGYVTAIQKNVRMENVDLRDRYNAALERMRTASEHYRELLRRHCGGGGLADNVCDTTDAIFREILEAQSAARHSLCKWYELFYEAVGERWHPSYC